jgi:hypothetical protein
METNDRLALNPESIGSVLQTTPDILKRNELSVSKCNAAGQALLDTIESKGGQITSDDLDTSVRNYIEKVNVTLKGEKGEGGMYNRRKPVTQLLTAISKRFTTLENEIDPKAAGTIPYRLQVFRDRYAAEKLAEQRKREEEARRKKLAEDEKISYRAGITGILNEAYTKYAESVRENVTAIYNSVTLENYAQKIKDLHQTEISFVWGDYVKYVKDSIITVYMDTEAKNAIKQEVAADRKKEYVKSFNMKFLELKASLIERMPSKKKALEEESELRRKDAEAAARAEAARKKREAEEAALLEAERKREDEARRLKAETERQTAEATAALNLMNDITPAPVKAKVSKKIRVLNPKGFVEIYSLWFMHEGVNLPVTDLEKIHKKMITFCEKEANREGGETLKSAFIQYVDDVKAK